MLCMYNCTACLAKNMYLQNTTNGERRIDSETREDKPERDRERERGREKEQKNKKRKIYIHYVYIYIYIYV